MAHFCAMLATLQAMDEFSNCRSFKEGQQKNKVMMIDYGNTRFAQLEEEVELFNEMGIPQVKKVTGIINAVKTALADLRVKLNDAPFDSTGDEIQFFKHIKPKFHAVQIFALEVFKIDADKPLGDEMLFKNYFEQELKFIRNFLNKHQFIYQYYLLGGTELDLSYFTRGRERSGVLLPDGPDLDPQFSTPGDYLFAKFLAIEKLQEYLIQNLYNPGGLEPMSKATRQRGAFKWTGDKSNLIELAYGIFDTVQINNGKVTIAVIIEWLEESFSISLSRYYRRFTEIKMRKSISKTKYLDEMREALARHISEGDAYKPQPAKPSSKPK
jgi:hypothetical protein